MGRPITDVATDLLFSALPGAVAQVLRVVHELQVHQIELEMQNEELRRVRDELEASLAPEDRDRAREAGFDAHLPKPPGLDAVNAVLAKDA